MKPRANARQAKRAEANELWCSLGNHATYKHAGAKEQFPGGTVCVWCQVKIAINISELFPVPELSVAELQRQRTKFERSREQRRTVAKVMEGAGNADGLVYYIRINGQIKIGYTADLRQRSRNYPPGSELLAVEPGTLYTERDRHQQFHRSLARGREWFTPTPDLLDHIDDLAKEYGIPTDLMHEFTT